MILKRFYDPKLAQASYLIGCGKTGAALVIDPNRDTRQYIAMAASEGVRITHVSETHIHADFLSGARELAQRTGARLLLSDAGDQDWKYRYAASDGAVLLNEGSSFKVGNVKVDITHTPGHTPEHITFTITDTAAADRPIGIVTGDFVFVGDVGRPDLLEKAARVKGTMDQAARLLFRSLQRFKALPDYLQIWPGHGAGSACGKGLSAIPHSTVGYERLFNWAFAITDEDQFVREVLAGQPDPPKYFAEMKRINRDGPALLGQPRTPPLLDAGKLPSLLRDGAVVIDARSAAEHAAGHVPGTLNIPLNKSFTNWAGWLVPYDRDIYLVLGDKIGTNRIGEAVHDLASIGLDRVAGYFDMAALREVAARNGGLATIPQVDPRQVRELLREGKATVIDVRARSEWDEGHIPGVANIPLGQLADRTAELPGGTLVLQCQGGGRSSIAASLLRSRGFTDVANMSGGFSAWEKQGGEVSR